MTLPHAAAAATTTLHPFASASAAHFAFAVRLAKSSYGRILCVLRFAGVVLLNLLWHCFLKHVYSPSVVFVVYGSPKIERSFFPAWASPGSSVMAKMGRPIPVLCFLRGSNRTGLVVAANQSYQNMQEDPTLVSRLQDDVIRAFPRAQAIALAGRLPSLLHRGGGRVKAPVVGGTVGTRYAMLAVARDLARRAGVTSGAATIAVIGGAGHVGSQIARDLAGDFARVVAIDPRFDRTSGTGARASSSSVPAVPNNLLETSDPAALRGIRLFLVFTPRGDDLAPWVPHMEPGSFVADDTHPCVGPALRAILKSRGIRLLKAAAKNDREPLAIVPRLPNFRTDSVPGCLLEALVVARCDGRREATEVFEEFCDTARSLGFGAQLMEDLEEVLVASDAVAASQEGVTRNQDDRVRAPPGKLLPAISVSSNVTAPGKVLEEHVCSSTFPRLRRVRNSIRTDRSDLFSSIARAA